MSRSQWLTHVGVALLTTVAIGATGSPAFAAGTGTVSVSGTSQIVFKAGSGKVNTLRISRSGRTVTVNDGVTLKAGKGCKQVKNDRTQVRCTTKKTPALITAYLGDKNDSLTGNLGTPLKVYGGSGNDRLTGGSGNDRIVGESGNDRVYGAAGNDSLDGGTGNDRIVGNQGHDKVWGGAGDDSILGHDGDDTLYGDAGNDVIEGSWGTDKVWGGSGNDRLGGGDGNDRLDGGAGADALTGANGHDSLYGSSGNDSIDGGTGNDTLHGGDGDDALKGGTDRDKEYGGAGNDRFLQSSLSSGDDDLFVGNAGNDEVSYVSRTNPVYLSNNGVSRDDGARRNLNDKWVQVEFDTISTDVESLVGGAGHDRIFGGRHADILTGGRGSDLLDGGDGNDVLYGGGRTGVPDEGNELFNNTLIGGAGDDRLFGGAANDVLIGDYNTPSDIPRPVGTDRLDGGSGDNTVSYQYAGSRVAVLALQRGSSSENGEKDENDYIRNAGGIIGSGYDDELTGGGGYHTDFRGGAGNDVMRALTAGSQLMGGTGEDRIYGGPATSSWGDSLYVDDHVKDELIGGTHCNVFPLDEASGCELVHQN
ncbi:hypothetical protein AMIS_78440 [Actinoplanes missouriensis 431]|uniref:Hemolysin-type calcium-binding protein n=1 Tax=Actinoplanes missouriensis (strain ATCC 14538 / DSM 43046 / CBS 188.64 / JCM 3121 / NBRC 102363 / NCIMB 12654 / NRRL B-3342 / UNCC 431) TaxID=512565 RepID=I0HJ77_ACTM4|nr:calcium-binding protein [Actinoplanes missouriensis]BAL93064.1 hypothetical protein AMIS_78440 [Actinoplanes missouriensis 431]